jgi:hypothetical protein
MLKVEKEVATAIWSLQVTAGTLGGMEAIYDTLGPILSLKMKQGG